VTERGHDEFVLGPRVTVFALLREYPFLRDYLVAYHGHFTPLRASAGDRGWARVAGLGQAAVAMNVSWVELARDIAVEIERVTGAAPAVAVTRRPAGDAGERAAAIGELVAELERGGSLLELSGRLKDMTARLDDDQAEALERALRASGAGTPQGVGVVVDAVAVPGETASPPPGHPLDTLQREGRQVRRLCDELRVTLQRLGGAPSRRRWEAVRPLVGRLVNGLSGVEQRFRRHRQAWFPALAVLGVEGPAVLLEDREVRALEAVRRLRLAVDRDDAAFVAEVGSLLLDLLDDILSLEQEVLAPLAARRFSEADWAAVRELEDGVGWALIPPPPPWPPV
jgi:DUF438 domain-containing protein